MRVVIALGGNALLKRGEPMTAEALRANIKVAALAISDIVNLGHEVVVTHGNGPQIGYLAMQSFAGQPLPLDVLGAQTEGMIGYLIQQELINALPGTRRVATLLTQIEVDPNDKAFLKPTKPIGPVYPKDEAERLARENGWHIAAVTGGFRRVVASPAPQTVLELSTICSLVHYTMVLICAGGGGVPVARDKDDKLYGVDAVIDKDAASALLAHEIHAQALLMLTDVEGVYEKWGTPDQRLISQVRAGDIRADAFETGSMAPKIEAAIRFVGQGGVLAGIGTLSQALETLEGKKGTIIKP
jgi:carbamate kinase